MTPETMPTINRKAALTTAGVIFLLIAVVLVGCPQYNVYKRDKAGEAALKEAENSKLVEIEQARAHLESEKLNAQSEIERAKGAAEAIGIENGQLTDRYIRYLYVRQTDLSNAQTIYIPTEGGLPILEAGRNVKAAP